MTIIRQSLQNHTDTYAGLSSDKTTSSQTHPAAPISLSVQGSRHILDDITNLIAEQKKTIDSYLVGLIVSPIPQVEMPIIETGSNSSLPSQIVPPTVSDYTSFEIIKKDLSDRQCEYGLPIDNTDIKLASHIQWGLDHCLLTVSAAQKVYPNDILTHAMMRVIAQRAGFEVKMEYSSSKPVSREQFVAFFYTLQQKHQIGDLPVVSMSTPLRRSEYIVFLHKLFGDVPQKPMSAIVSVGTGGSGAIQSNVFVPVTNAVQNTGLHETGIPVATDMKKEIMKQTVNRLIEKI